MISSIFSILCLSNQKSKSIKLQRIIDLKINNAFEILTIFKCNYLHCRQFDISWALRAPEQKKFVRNGSFETLDAGQKLRRGRLSSVDPAQPTLVRDMERCRCAFQTHVRMCVVALSSGTTWDRANDGNKFIYRTGVGSWSITDAMLTRRYGQASGGRRSLRSKNAHH